MADIRLTPTAYIVLGLIAQAEGEGEGEGGVTPYDLKAKVATGIGNLWSLQHTQLYAEPERLAKAGYLTEVREQSGRRRKLYSITPAGREALSAWLAAAPADDLPEIRYTSLLKVYFGADPKPIAIRQAAAHRAKLREYEELERGLECLPESGELRALRAGLAHERVMVRYWADLAGEPE